MTLNKFKRQLREYELRMEGKMAYENELINIKGKPITHTRQLRIRYLINKISRM